MLLSFVSVGQTSTNKCQLKTPPACFPQGGFLLTEIDGKFEDLFPPHVMKEKHFTKIIIKPIENNKRPTINVQSDNTGTYQLNQDGFVVEWKLGSDRTFSYQRNEDNLLKTYSDLKISKNGSSLDKYNYTKTNNELTIERTLYQYDTENQLIAETPQDKKVVQYDSKNRVIEVKNLLYHKSVKTYTYDDSSYFSVQLINNNLAIADTVFFNKNWQPISNKFWNYNIDFGHEYKLKYNQANKIILQQRTGIINAKGDIDYIYFQYKFVYREDGLLDKIVRTNENCTYQVYYYTE